MHSTKVELLSTNCSSLRFAFSFLSHSENGTSGELIYSIFGTQRSSRLTLWMTNDPTQGISHCFVWYVIIERRTYNTFSYDVVTYTLCTQSNMMEAIFADLHIDVELT